MSDVEEKYEYAKRIAVSLAGNVPIGSAGQQVAAASIAWKAAGTILDSLKIYRNAAIALERQEGKAL